MLLEVNVSLPVFKQKGRVAIMTCYQMYFVFVQNGKNAIPVYWDHDGNGTF